jgi:hypothetical protein
MRIAEFYAEEKERNEKIRLITAAKNAALNTAFMAIVTEKKEAKVVGFIVHTRNHEAKQQKIIRK